MNIDNPFTNGEIKNYLLFYVSIIVIIILFFIASTIFNNVKKIDKKNFNTKIETKSNKQKLTQRNKKTTKFKLMDKIY